VNNIDTVSEFEQAHFDAASVTIRRHDIDIPAQMGGLVLTGPQIRGLAGAPTGSTITLRFRQYTAVEEGQEEVPPGLYFETENHAYIRSKNVIGVFRDGASGYGIYLKFIDFKAGGPKGLAARMLAIIVRRAFEIGNIKRLRLLAAGGRSWRALDPETGERWGGYVAWPTYGFDMELLPKTLKLAREFPYYPQGLMSRRKVSEVLQVPGGREYWRVAGDGHYMDFDLSSKATPSIARLDSFLERAAI
jgi:hypothetical protein